MAVVVIASLVGLIAIVLRVAPGQQRQQTRALLGLLPGLIGALIVVALATDAVPDSFEAFALPWLIIAVTIALILLTVRSLTDH